MPCHATDSGKPEEGQKQEKPKRTTSCHNHAQLIPPRAQIVVALVAETDDRGADNVAWLETRRDADLVLFGGADILNPDRARERVPRWYGRRCCLCCWRYLHPPPFCSLLSSGGGGGGGGGGNIQREYRHVCLPRVGPRHSAKHGGAHLREDGGGVEARRGGGRHRGARARVQGKGGRRGVAVDMDLTDNGSAERAVVPSADAGAC